MADVWVFLNLILALLFSIPAINFFTHGTHITVAHSMGTTIGINTTILLASVLFIVNQIKPDFNLSSVKKGFRIFNISLLLFWLSLLAAGVKRSHWMYFTKGIPFSEMQSQSHWIYSAFLLFGTGIFIGLLFITVPVLKTMLTTYSVKEINENEHP